MEADAAVIELATSWLKPLRVAAFFKVARLPSFIHDVLKRELKQQVKAYYPLRPMRFYGFLVSALPALAVRRLVDISLGAQ